VRQVALVAGKSRADVHAGLKFPSLVGVELSFFRSVIFGAGTRALSLAEFFDVSDKRHRPYIAVQESSPGRRVVSYICGLRNEL
jgi:hypothetical protein